MLLKELGIEYIEIATQLRNRAKALDTTQNTAQAREVRARICELRAVAARMKKYGRYLQKYYETEGSNHAK